MKKLLSLSIVFLFLITTITAADTSNIHQDNNPPSPPTIVGPTQIRINVDHNFTFSTVDPDGDDIYFLIEWGDGTFADNKQYSSVQIIPPPNDGIYLGQYEWLPGDIETFEKAIQRKVAWFSPHGVMEYDASGYPVFNRVNAEKSWKEGKIVLVHAIEADPDPTEGYAEESFTIDKLCKGVYDDYLERLADQFATFGKPMFFHTAREPLGIGVDYMGGFGPSGDKSTSWAIKHKRAYDEFDPSSFPHPELYTDLGDPTVSDGIERLVAAQRYYHHFFITQKGLDFLTFDTMGWVCMSSEMLQSEINEYINRTGFDKTYVEELYNNSYDFQHFYPGDKYVDWISINFYGCDWRIFGKRIEIPIEYFLNGLDHAMSSIREVAADKPVFFLEFGFADGMKEDSVYAAQKITATFDQILSSYPEIHGFSMWSYHPFWRFYFPFDCLIRPGTAQADALTSIINQKPDFFHSDVYFSNGNQIPTAYSVDQKWIGPFSSGETISLSNLWFEEGTKLIRVKAKDIHGLESNYSTMEITLPHKQTKSFLDIINQIFSDIFHFSAFNKV